MYPTRRSLVAIVLAGCFACGSVPAGETSGAPASRPRAGMGGRFDAGRPVDEAKVLSLMKEKHPRMYELAMRLKESQPERYTQLLRRAERFLVNRDAAGPGSAMPAPDPRITRIREQIMSIVEANEVLRAEIHERARAARATQGEERAKLETALREMIAKAFDATTQRKTLELEERRIQMELIKARLEAQEKTLEKRKASRDAAIGQFLDATLNRSHVASGASAGNDDAKDE